MKDLIVLAGRFARLFSENRISMAAAALSYYLTMTLFPLLIVVYTLLGNSSDSVLWLMEFAGEFLSEGITDFIFDFLSYVSESRESAMLPLGLAVLLSYASAGIRSMLHIISSIQGGAEYKGLRSYLISFVYSLMLLAVLYFALVVMLVGRGLVERINSCLPGMAFLFDWLYLRYIILAAVLFFFMLGIFHVPKRRQDSYSVLPGAAFVSLGVVGISPLFSAVMGQSVKYSLVYGSIASLILLMLWLYMCCVLIYSGAVLNMALHEAKKK